MERSARLQSASESALNGRNNYFAIWGEKRIELAKSSSVRNEMLRSQNLLNSMVVWPRPMLNRGNILNLSGAYVRSHSDMLNNITLTINFQ